MNISEACFWATRKLNQCQIEQPDVSARILLEQILVVAKEYLYLNPEQKLTAKQEDKYRSWVSRRSKNEPVWYITNKIEFYGQEFFVNKDVLIPRQETELLVERFMDDNKSLFKSDARCLEVGTGSGAIIITLASKLKGGLFASDISAKALRVAQRNADKLNCRTKILFKKGNLFEPWVNMKFDYIVANLPYILHSEIPSPVDNEITEISQRIMMELEGHEKHHIFTD
jgi:release factor glutamine methyltransferase